MPRGRQSPLPKDKLEFLESHFPEFLAKQPNLGRFWVDVVKEWFIRWPVEHRLGLEVISTHGVLIEDSGLSQEHQKLVGDAQEAEKNIIHNWFNNRSQKEKRALNSSGSSASNLKSLEKLLSSAQSRQTRKNHKVELWQKRHPDIMEAALQASNFDSLMPKAKAQETVEERRARIKVGRTAQMQLRRKTAAGLFAKASDEEKASVEEEWLRQERPSKAAVMKASTPEEYQNGLDKIGPWLKTFHGVVGDALGWVGATVLTGPIPNQGGKIGTQSYCHGVTPAGHTIDQALPGWHEHVITPVQQFGKKVFDHDARRARAMKPADAAESHHDPVEPVTSAGQEPRRRKRRAKAKESAVDEADPFPPPSSAFTNIPVSSFNDVPSPPPSPPPASSFTDVPGGLDYSALQPFADFGDLNLNIDIDPETMRALEESSQEFMWETRALEGVDGLGAPAASTSEHESSAMASPTVHAATPATRPTPRATYRGSSFATTTPTQQSDSTATSTQHDDGDNPLERFEVTPLSSESSANQGLATYVADFVFDPRPSTSSAGFPRPAYVISDGVDDVVSALDGFAAPATHKSDSVSAVPAGEHIDDNIDDAASTLDSLATPTLTASSSLAIPAGTATVTTPSPLRAVHTPPATVRPMSALAIGRTPEASGSGDAGVTTTARGRCAMLLPRWGEEECAAGEEREGGAPVLEGEERAEAQLEVEEGGLTYDDDGSTIPLPLGTPVETVSLARTQEIRNAAKERDSAKARAARARDHGVHVFPPPPPGHEALRAEPAALGGRPAAAPAVPSVPPPLTPRKRRAPTNLGKAYIPQKKRTLAEIRSEAEQKKQMAEAATGMKRKADENGKTRTTKKRKVG
ncbi:hypothetical protein DFH06DRAFT_1346225 [Mycena polygramma]|nr:hypothetical protein DFH06DRAFT_1346225 [Mycena polygramma]